ncbi:hypothetical protein D3C86_1093580 [compost metagenome]
MPVICTQRNRKAYLSSGRCAITRLYIQPSFVNSCEEHGLWSGGNDQYRGDRSVDVATFDKNGRARVEAFSDSAIESLKKRKTSIPLADRILPQAKRVRLLTEQLYELEAERKNGMDVHTYSQLRDILICKRNRAEELYKKAIAVKPTQPDEDDIDLYTELPEDEGVYEVTNNVSPTIHTSIVPAWLEGISDDNSCKKVIIKACVWMRKVIQLSQAVRNYINELKAI